MRDGPLNIVATTTSFAASGATTSIATANGMSAGDTLPGTNPNGTAQTVTFQIRYIDGSSNTHIVTAWLSGENIGGKCLFFGQAMTSGWATGPPIGCVS